MCKKIFYKSSNPKMDKCMEDYVRMINKIILPIYETKASCCGHGKYPKTVVIGLKKYGSQCFDLFSGQIIPRKRRFYKRDKEGYYYIPETLVK